MARASLPFFLASAFVVWGTLPALPSANDSVTYANIHSRIGAGATPSKADLEIAAGIYRKDGDVWWRLAQGRLAAKEYDGAIAAYHEALKYGAFGNKFRAACEYDLACAHVLKGEKDVAYGFLQKAMDHGFRDLQHLRTDTDLNSLHSDARWETLAATKDVTKMSRDEGWRYDLWLLDREVRRIHFDPYRLHDASDHAKWVKDLHDRIPRLADHEIAVHFMKYMRRMGDGHTSIRPASGTFTFLPIQLYWFEEGLFVVASDPKYGELIGAQVLEIGGRSIDAWMKLLDTVTAQDNSQGLRSTSAQYLTVPALLHGLAAQPKAEELIVKVKLPSGETTSTLVQAGPSAAATGDWKTLRDTTGEQPLYLKSRQKAYWFEHLPDIKAVYFQYNAVRSDTPEDINAFAIRMFKFIDDNDIERLIVDARWNGGGNSFLNRPLVNGIIGSRKINSLGKLFVVIGRQTFSAAQNFVTDIGRQCDAIFVGEPTGSSPNFVGETIRFTLPYSKMAGSISDLYWQRSWPMDARTWIAPTLPAPPSVELFKANRDPAMEAIRAYIAQAKN